MLFTSRAGAQSCNPHTPSWWPSPKYFSSGTNLCDETPWKLVFYDDFKGTKLDTSKWYPYDSNNLGFTPDWCEARGNDQDEALARDSNVVVSNGTVKLYLKQEYNYWGCQGCDTMNCSWGPMRNDSIEWRNYSSGTLSTHTTFNNGWFQARIKMPLYKKEHCSWWLWHYNPVDEIDFAESTGWGNNIFNSSQRPIVRFNLHAWNPDGSKEDVKPKKQLVYPGQSWWLWLIGDYFHQDDWHIYGCEWDTASLTVFLDYQKVKTIWKYYQCRTITVLQLLFLNYPLYYKVGSQCHPAEGTWKITPGFPYNDSARCKLIFSSGIETFDKLYSEDTTLGAMEVDWIKVWQRHPEQDAHTSLCQVPNVPVISKSGGISQQSPAYHYLCNDEVFTATPAISGGYWSVEPTAFGATVNSSGVNGNTAYAETHRPVHASGAGYVEYNYPSGDEDICPVQSSVFPVNCPFSPVSEPMTFVVNTQALGVDSGIFQLFVPKKDGIMSDDGSSFKWNIKFVPRIGADTQYITKYGRFISTAAYRVTGRATYYLHWNVTRKIGDDTVMWQGTRTAKSSYGEQSDTANYFLNAFISDTAAYLNDVRNGVAQLFFPADVADSTVKEHIERVMAEALEPYIIQSKSGNKRQPQTAKTDNSLSRLYPNPAGNDLYVIPGSKFENSRPLEIQIFDLFGHLRKNILKGYRAGDVLKMSLSDLNNGVYIVKLRQGAYSERYKIVKYK